MTVRKIIPPGVTFTHALRSGYIGRMLDEKYLGWVRSLPCVQCGRDGADPHHPHGIGFRGGATKCPDLWCFPLCREHHDELHADTPAWELRNGDQAVHALLTITRARYEGVL